MIIMYLLVAWDIEMEGEKYGDDSKALRGLEGVCPLMTTLSMGSRFLVQVELICESSY